MARRLKKVEDYPAAIRQLKGLLDSFVEELDQPDLRTKVVALIPAVYGVRSLGASLITREEASAAPARILFYLRKYPLTLIEGDELMVVSGIGEWARRLRELRVQQGWWIFSGVTFKEMLAEEPEQLEDLKKVLLVDPGTIKPDQYVLMRVEQDRDAAHRWHTLNSIRRKNLGVKEKLLEYFRANVGRVISGEELRYLAKNRKEWARRTRELRTQSGWPVVTRQQGRPDLPVGSYLLEEDRQSFEHDRTISDSVRVEVLERDQFSCRVCGWSREQAKKDDPRRLLELHHIQEHAKGGSNEVANLLTLCNVHHDEVHASRLNLNAYL
jgi:hypothetical protein